VDTQLPVVVVGAGPVGIVAANLLDLAGVPVVVVDRDRDVHPLPRAANLDDEALRILQGLGVAGAVHPAITPVPGMQLLAAPGDVLWHLRADGGPGPNGWPRTNLFAQPAVERVLRARLRRGGRARLLLGRELRALDDHGGVARLTVADPATGALEELCAAAVLGCDGARSTVRRLLGVGLRDHGFEQRWLVVDAEVDGPPLPVGLPQQVCDPAAPMTYVPMAPRAADPVHDPADRAGRGRYRWEFLLPAGVDEAAFLAAAPLAARVAPWTGGRPVRVVRQVAYRFHALRAERWRVGRVFLLGDAAHQMPPFLGQGLCAGLRDAANLTWKLALVRAGRAGDALLDTYEAERLPHVELTTGLAVLVGRVVTSRDAGGAGLRAALRVGRRLPAPLRRRLGDVQTPGLRPGPLVRPARRSAGRVRATGLLGWGEAGFPLPQPFVSTGGQPVLLDDLLGPGFALVALDTDPWDLLSPGARRWWQALGTRAVRVAATAGIPPGGAGPAVDLDGVLGAWFRRWGARVAVVRPDRYVLAVCEGTGLPGLEAVTKVVREGLAA